ncbi:hypothetical protein [Bradyrhizobium semiaridum]|uniref:hypothetical protein n=1 Tax=Bradyrhizobium semiaridum TaxID=2821404 RepID=UPI001CE2B33C|nr:hypothetical protein [Bradyrhizobium semiaridum]
MIARQQPDVNPPITRFGEPSRARRWPMQAAQLDVLDTPRELAFDRLTSLCRKTFRVPMSTLTFIDGHRQWVSPGQCFDNMLRNADWRCTAPSRPPAIRRWPGSTRRRRLRQPHGVFKAGAISFSAGHSTLSCTVRGLSRDSATLEVTSTAGIPEQFKLAISADALSRACPNHGEGRRPDRGCFARVRSGCTALALGQCGLYPLHDCRRRLPFALQTAKLVPETDDASIYLGVVGIHLATRGHISHDRM